MPKQSSIGGWLNTKKRGRDDNEIAKDMKKALAERRKRRVAGVTAKKKAFTKKVNQQRKTNKKASGGRRRRKDDGSEEEEEEEEEFTGFDESDDDSINDFVVDDDASEEENGSSDEDDELEVVFKPKQRKPLAATTSRPANKRPRTLTPQASSESSPVNLDGSDSDSDVEDKSFFDKYKARPSKPSKALQYGSISATNRKVKPAPKAKAQSTRMSTPPSIKSSRPAFATYNEDLTSPEMASPNLKKRGAALKLDDDDSDSEAEVTSKFFPKGKRAGGSKSKQSGDSLLKLPAKKPRRNEALLDSSDEEDVGPSRKLNAKKPIKRAIIDDDDEDDDDDFQKALRPSMNPHDDDGAIIIDEPVDEDEEKAIKLAIKASKKEAKMKKEEEPAEGDKGDVGSDGEKIAVLDETSDEEEDVEDEYEDEKRAASSVLETAEQLSAEVLKAMLDWQQDGDDSLPDASQGMIMDDGALSLFALKDKKPSDESCRRGKRSWITKEEMERICPDVTLSDYQLIGVNWLALLHGMKCSIEGKRSTNVCGVLADQMGLGKTVQTIAFLAWLKDYDNTVDLDEDDVNAVKEPRKPHLVVVPVSVLDNWMREFDTFCPSLNVVKYHGSQAERRKIQEEMQQYLPHRKPERPLDIILCPITFFQKEKSPDKAFLGKFKYEYLVVDEAHMLKNCNSIRYRMLNKVSSNRRLLLTGTPVQNSPQELLNMLCFLMPLFSRAGSSNPFEDDGRSNGTERMLQHFVDQTRAEADDAYAYKKLKQLFAPFVLRRKKDDVLAQIIPPKKRVVEFVDLDPGARKIYDDIIAEHLDKSGTKVSAGIGESLFTNLRKAAHHSLLLRTRHTSKEEIDHLVARFHQYGAFKGEASTKERVAEELSSFNDFDIHLTALELIEENPIRSKELERYTLSEDDLFCSAKFERLRQIIPPLIKDGHRILIFSTWTMCLDLLGCLMQNLGLDYLRMDGSSPSKERQIMIDKFNRTESISVFLLSTRACGVGINLTAADTCIIHDLDFNPFNDLQAEDRCHRIGQKRPVTVFKMVTKDTVDSQIYNMQERKAKMNAAIMDSKAERKEKLEVLNSAIDQFKNKPMPEKESNRTSTLI